MGTINEIDAMFKIDEDLQSRLNIKSDGRTIMNNGISSGQNFYIDDDLDALEIRRLDEEYRRRASRVSCEYILHVFLVLTLNH